MLGEGAPFLGLGPQHRVRRDLRQEVAPQIGGEVGVAPIADRLDGPHDGGGVDAEAARQVARRQEEGLVGALEDGLDQPLTAGAEPVSGLREAEIERQRGGRPALSGRRLGGSVLHRCDGGGRSGRR